VSVGIFLLKSIALFSLEITQIQLRRSGEKAKPVGLECSMIDKVGKRIFDPAKIIVGPSQIMQGSLPRFGVFPLIRCSRSRFLHITISC
jgi:hypothetical protein